MKRCPSCSLSNDDGAAFCIRCGFPLTAVAAEPARSSHPASAPPQAGYLGAGALIDGKYEIARVLGEGGMGIVYLARDIHTDTPVVVKSIRHQFADDPEFRARTLAEGRALARIDHPNVVRLNAVVVEPKALYLIMQFIDGDPLDRIIEQRIAERAAIPVSLAVAIFRMILAGVGAAHAEGLIHRDLKPANILVRRKDGVAKVTDFGIAKGEEDAKAGRGLTKGIIGSLSYMAPEQVRGQRDLDKRVDIYALGILLFELLIGRVPFDAPSDYELMRMHTEMPLPSLRALRPDIPAALEAAVLRACAKDRDARFASTDEFARALDAPGSGTAHMDSRPPLPYSGQPARPNGITDGTEIAFEHPPFEQSHGPTAPREVARSGPRASLVPPAPAGHRRKAGGPLLWAGGALALAAAVGGVVLVTSNSDDHVARRVSSDGGTGPATTTGATVPSTTSSRSTTGAAMVDGGARASAPSPLARLVGSWRSSANRDFTAVLTTPDALEFRIVKASQHPRQNYHDGDVRFRLLAIPGATDQFAVEDHLRPTPPDGVEYTEASRSSCIGTWTAVSEQPLRAVYDGGGGLAVDLVQVRQEFELDGKRVVRCTNVGASPATRIVSQLTRIP
jgi:serine/threonine protein kinase